MYGDGSGNVVLFYFRTPQQHLFEPNQKNAGKSQQIYMQVRVVSEHCLSSVVLGFVD